MSTPFLVRGSIFVMLRCIGAVRAPSLSVLQSFRKKCHLQLTFRPHGQKSIVVVLVAFFHWLWFFIVGLAEVVVAVAINCTLHAQAYLLSVPAASARWILFDGNRGSVHLVRPPRPRVAHPPLVETRNVCGLILELCIHERAFKQNFRKVINYMYVDAEIKSDKNIFPLWGGVWFWRKVEIAANRSAPLAAARILGDFSIEQLPCLTDPIFVRFFRVRSPPSSVPFAVRGARSCTVSGHIFLRFALIFAPAHLHSETYEKREIDYGIIKPT